VELHGGSISASSDGEGLGSKFRVTLPLWTTNASASLAAPPELDQPAVPVAVNPRRILLVDDNVDAADAMGTLLRASGHQVVVAYGPIEALAFGTAFAPDVAVLDNRPCRSWTDISLLANCAIALGAGAPAMIALSGYGQERDRERSAEHGFAAHLVKPTTVDEVLLSVQCARTPHPEDFRTPESAVEQGE
jgi:CheY-like chemotaxis protein